MTRDGIVHLDGWSSKIFSSFGGFVRLDFYPLDLLSYGAFVQFFFSLSAHVTAWRECWSSTPVSCDHMTRDGIVHLDGWSSKIFSSFGGFVHLDFYPLDLLSYGAFVQFFFSLSAHVTAWRECWSSTPVSCDHMTRDGIVHLNGWSSKIFSSFGGFVRLDFYALGLLSYGAFVHYGFSLSAHVTAWRECWSSTPVSCDHITRDLIVHLDGWSSKIFSSFGGFVHLDFYPLGLLSYGAFVHFGSSLSTHMTDMMRMLIVHTCIVITWPEMGSYTLMVGVVKYFHLLGVLSALIFKLWGCCPMVLLSILVFLCPPTWPHDENVDRPHLYHVITWPEMGSYTLMVGVVKYFHLLGVLSALIFILWIYCPMVLLSNFSLLCPPTSLHDENVDRPHLYHVITWPKMGIVHLDGWSSKIFSSFGGFVRLDFYPLGLLSYGAFVHFGSSLSAHMTSMMRMLIVHTCIMWSHDQRWDRTPWWLE